MPHDQEAVEQTKRDCRDDEQIHRRNIVGMIIEKSFPALGRRPSYESQHNDQKSASRHPAGLLDKDLEPIAVQIISPKGPIDPMLATT
jgi:hypothetical protein